MLQVVVGLILFCFEFVQPFGLYAQDQIRDLVVKIHATHHTPDLLRPWTKNSPQQVKGSGVVIDGKRILTNAHVVRYASQIYVQPNQSSRRIPARVEAITPALDLATLKLDDESFFDKRGTLPFAPDLPRVKDNVNVYGYPTGGTELSVTQGIVSRIEYTEYYYQGSGLRIQVDAALNFGNSGGPAVTDGKPQMLDVIQTVENEALRQKLRLPDGTNGVMVTEPYRPDPDYPLKEWDVITQIGDTPIDSDGKVAVRYDLRLSAAYLVQNRTRNRRLPLTVFRDGKVIHVDLLVLTQRELVIPYLMANHPKYFILGPLVFSATSQDFLERLGNQRPAALGQRPSPLITRRYDKPAFPGEELVVVASPMFPHRMTNGYDDPNRAVLSEVNSVPVKNLRYLVEILRDNRDGQITFKFAKSGALTSETMVFNRQELIEATGKILEDNGIRYPYSPDLAGVWETYLTAAPRATRTVCCPPQ